MAVYSQHKAKTTYRVVPFMYFVGDPVFGKLFFLPIQEHLYYFLSELLW